MTEKQTLRIALLALLVLTPAGLVHGELTPYFPTLHPEPLVYIDDTVLTVLDFGRYLAGTGTVPTGIPERDRDSLWLSLQALIDEAVIVHSSDTVALLADPATARRGRWRCAHVAGRAVIEHDIVPQIDVTDEDVLAFYQDSLKTLYTAPKRREVRQILITRKRTGPDGQTLTHRESVDRAFAVADSLADLIQQGASFDSLAAICSDDTLSRAQNGYLGWIYPGNTTFEFDTAAFQAEIGEVRGPVKTPYGYHLLLVEAERPESTLALTDSISATIRFVLTVAEGNRLATLWADSALAASRWDFNDDVLDDSVMQAEDTTWVLIINGRDTVQYREWIGGWEYYKHTQRIQGPGTPEEKHKSLQRTGFPLLYLQTAEDHGFATHPLILNEHYNHLRSEALQRVRERLRVLQEVPPFDSSTVAAPDSAMTEEPLHLQMIRARDSASIWAAYRSLVAGRDIATVARWYHDDMRDVRAGLWDLGWVGKEDLPPGLFGPAWILTEGRYTRPLEADSAYYILRLVERRRTRVTVEEMLNAQNEHRRKARADGLARWRDEIRAGHTIRVNRSTWQRVVRLWRR